MFGWLRKGASQSGGNEAWSGNDTICLWSRAKKAVAKSLMAGS
jgi:hypothetical protein